MLDQHKSKKKKKKKKKNNIVTVTVRHIKLVSSQRNIFVRDAFENQDI